MERTESDAVPGDLPEALEAAAGEILLGPAQSIDDRFALLCAANPGHRTALERLRADCERAARLLAEPIAPAPEPIPAQLGPYRLVRRIGAGAFGVVYLAEQRQPIRREVAVKLLHTLTSSPATTARFLNERETLARMNHPAIARIYDAGIDTGGRPYFVMEHVPGEPLHRFVATRAADLVARVELFLRACDGVNHAHQRGVIHRDLKPQNILVAEVDGQWQPKVIDFGLAKVLDPDPDLALQTHAGTVLGTPAYMSPEQVRGDAHEADTRTDVYALGVILYELLTSALPIALERPSGRGLLDLRQAILEVEPPLASLRAMQAGMPYARLMRGDVDWILRRAMAKQQAERYATVAELAADLRRWLADEPVSAGPPSAGYLLRKFVRRHRVAVAAGALVFGSLVAGGLASWWSWRQAAASEATTRAHLADFWRLADVVELERLVAAEAELWPSEPARLADHERWVADAEHLLARRGEHAATIASLRARLAGAVPLSSAERRGAEFLATSLERHLTALDALGAPGGPLESVARRTAFARNVGVLSLDEQRAAWDDAIAAVAASPRYGGLRLRPILGLVPLGPDPDSGLQEFAHLQSGEVPRRSADGRLQIGADTGIVLVLVPGGEVLLGAQATDPDGPNYDPMHHVIEYTLVRGTLLPYFIGKYELTQGQVAHLGVAVQALSRMGTREGDLPPYDGRYPEESVLGPAVRGWLPRFGLRLPHCSEWEAAARAGADAPWGAVDRPAGLQGAVNLADATLGDISGGSVAVDATLRDGYPALAPVGSLRANAYGLHDMLGNVAELVLGPVPGGDLTMFARGGSYASLPAQCRVGSTMLVTPNQSSPQVGLRVAKSLPAD